MANYYQNVYDYNSKTPKRQSNSFNFTQGQINDKQTWNINKLQDSKLAFIQRQNSYLQEQLQQSTSYSTNISSKQKSFQQRSREGSEFIEKIYPQKIHGEKSIMKQDESSQYLGNIIQIQNKCASGTQTNFDFPLPMNYDPIQDIVELKTEDEKDIQSKEEEINKNLRLKQIMKEDQEYKQKVYQAKKEEEKKVLRVISNKTLQIKSRKLFGEENSFDQVKNTFNFKTTSKTCLEIMNQALERRRIKQLSDQNLQKIQSKTNDINLQQQEVCLKKINLVQNAKSQRMLAIIASQQQKEKEKQTKQNKSKIQVSIIDPISIQQESLTCSQHNQPSPLLQRRNKSFQISNNTSKNRRLIHSSISSPRKKQEFKPYFVERIDESLNQLSQTEENAKFEMLNDTFLKPNNQFAQITQNQSRFVLNSIETNKKGNLFHFQKQMQDKGQITSMINQRGQDYKNSPWKNSEAGSLDVSFG